MTDFANIKSFKMSLEIECFSKKCNPNQKFGNGKIFILDIDKKFIPGKGLYLGDVFTIHDGNNCCYSSSLQLNDVKCPHCNKEYSLYLIN